MDLSLEEGRFLVEYARAEIEKHFEGNEANIPEDMKNLMSKKTGVYVKLNVYPSLALRGSAGYTETLIPLKETLAEVAVSAAIRDNRFHPLRKGELKTVLIEVSVITKPELITVRDPMEYPDNIEIGKDGIIFEKGFVRGVMLPQMAVEYRWNAKQFLSHACMIVGLKPEAWDSPEVKIHKFTARIFGEERPCGEIVERKFH